jgi:hypothetical protein
MAQEHTDIHEEAYSQYMEAQRQELRLEGAEEMRKEILRLIDAEFIKAWTAETRHGMMTAKVLAERATI